MTGLALLVWRDGDLLKRLVPPLVVSLIKWKLFVIARRDVKLSVHLKA